MNILCVFLTLIGLSYSGETELAQCVAQMSQVCGESLMVVQHEKIGDYHHITMGSESFEISINPSTRETGEGVRTIYKNVVISRNFINKFSNHYMYYQDIALRTYQILIVTKMTGKDKRMILRSDELAYFMVDNWHLMLLEKPK